ncbi:hypothetical protein [Herbidospora sp. RD11066]
MRRLLALSVLLAGTQCAAVPDAVYLVKNRDQTVRVYETDGDPVTGDITLPGTSRVLRVLAADDGFHVVTEAQEWGRDTYYRLRPPRYTPEPTGDVAGHALAITRDNTRAAYVTGTPEDATLVVRDLATGVETTTKTDPLAWMTWSPDGRRLLRSTSPICDDTSDCVFPETLGFLGAARPVKTFRTITAAAVIAGDRILVPKRGGTIEHYSTDGRLLARIRTPGEIAQLSVKDDHLLVVIAGGPESGGGTRLVTGPLTGGDWYDLPWNEATMETAAW